MNPGVLIRELRMGRGRTAALRMALWQVRGEIAASELGDPSTAELGILKRQQHLLLDIHARVDPATHRRVKAALEKATEHPAVKAVARRMAEKPPQHRTPTDFSALTNAFMKAGGFVEPQQHNRKPLGRPAEQTPPGTGPEAKPGHMENGVSAFRTSARMPTWRQTLHREHLRRGVLPIPAGVKITARRAGLGISLGIDHRSWAEAGRVRVVRTKLSDDGSHLVLEPPGWPSDFFPGIVLDMSWIPERRTFFGRTHELEGPLVIRGTAATIDGRIIAHRYDPQVIIRETAPGGSRSAVPTGLSDTDWVLRTLQILGYLDAEGRAVLAEDALERSMVGELGFPRGQTQRITQAVARLIGSGLVSRVKAPSTHAGVPPIHRCREELR
ncbi:hypothetical protein BZB76_3885 [Actinomadura pelletieri DSM 43383]|uniref:Uncharacterized protein n=1 Tax=Actinomadura pelletieri DSM 43383 TaxID=1120940 RepID=A0A495QKT8_9ACTN|nr:hypothetical protein BZB76_3885 [Actinomadura pelletieri DSM 43383]